MRAMSLWVPMRKGKPQGVFQHGNKESCHTLTNRYPLPARYTTGSNMNNIFITISLFHIYRKGKGRVPITVKTYGRCEILLVVYD